MSLGKIVVQTCAMVLTGAATQAGIKKGKELWENRKGTKAKQNKDEVEEAGTVSQLEE